MPSSFTDESTECAICFESLDGGEETLTLTCGHRWHTSCLKQQLQHALPSKSQRLLFSGCRCAKCNVFCDHPELNHLTRRTDALREKVDALVEEQLKADVPHAFERARQQQKHDRHAKSKLLDEGRRNYAFYLCGGCDEPYFGGTVECADEQEGELTASEDRLCQSCSPKSQEICQFVEHGAYHVWKCRYCCNPASFVCYGNVHFCKPCHDRNNTQRTRSRGSGRGDNHIPALEGSRCKGGTNCPFPKPQGQTAHKNGSTRDCEQVYYCAWCDSSSMRRHALEATGSRNFIVNPNGEEGQRMWHPVGFRGQILDRWKVENSEVRADPNTHTNFVSGFTWAGMMQHVPLHQYVRDPSSVKIEVSAKFMGRTDCPSVFRMQAIVTDANGRTIHQVATSELQSPAGYWEKATLTIDPVNGAHEVMMVVLGKDQRFWAGNYGSKVCHCSVRVLCEEDEIEDIVLPGPGIGA